MVTEKNIESIGFVFLKKEEGKRVFINKSKFNRDETIHFGEIKGELRYIVIENNCGQFYFMGWLKNKKELKKLLKQVGVSFSESSQADA
ncbi:hypothetical protein [Tenacibaculum finnmarkense]|uniref:hypothetical protein n=1 Tax=Tenacibaculum finnmarkense TaxID=2781243 RepID=UPI00187B4B45|nr:hypothetical protein [Tenacibaculum finnmarkense]MBE7649147.1 hypothetical protein [Tenacibaculum finnmarkense genomovar ulcerans]